MEGTNRATTGSRTSEGGGVVKKLTKIASFQHRVPKRLEPNLKGVASSSHSHTRDNPSRNKTRVHANGAFSDGGVACVCAKWRVFVHFCAFLRFLLRFCAFFPTKMGCKKKREFVQKSVKRFHAMPPLVVPLLRVTERSYYLGRNSFLFYSSRVKSGSGTVIVNSPCGRL